MNSPEKGSLNSGPAGASETPLPTATDGDETPIDPAREASDREDREWVATVAADASSEAEAKAAFEKLYGKYRERVYGILWRMLRNREDALDATQDVFIRVLRAIKQFNPDGRFFTWLYRIAVNRGIDIIRRRKTRKENAYDPDWTSEEESRPPESRRFRGPEENAEVSEFRERLEHAIAQLSEDHRAVFLLYSEEQLRYEEIAEVLDVPIGTVMSRLFHARRKLREQLPTEWDPGGRRRREDLRKKKAARRAKRESAETEAEEG